MGTLEMEAGSIKMQMEIVKDFLDKSEIEIKTGPFGTQLKAAEYQSSGIPVLNVKNLGFSTINTEKLDRVGDETVERLKAHLLKAGDIVFGRKGAVERHAFISVNEEGWMQGSDCIRLRVKTDKINPRFLSYYFLTKEHRAFMISMCSHGTTMASLNQKILEQICFPMPQRNIQDKIVDILERIDRKISFNNRINDNLYQQLDTIYRATYPYLPSDELPAGWNCVPLGTLCDSISIKHSFDKEKLVFLNTGDVENGHFLHSTYSLVQEMPGQAKKSIKTNDILYSEIRPINRHFAFVNFQADDYVVSTKLMVIRSREMDSRRLYHFLTTQDVINELQIEAESRSGTFPQIRFENIQRLPIIIAPPDIELQFTQILKDYYNMIDSNICENQYLATLRDSILPKLMSGEIDVSELDI